MTGVYLGLGSNVGDRAAHLAAALGRLDDLGRVAAVSGVYETDPVGYADQPSFLNLVAVLDTTLEPDALMERIGAIERKEGRVRSFRNAPRTLDIDILLFGDRTLDRPGLTVPHPRMTDRAFVLVPLLELAPALREPRTGRAYREYLDGLKETKGPGERRGPGIRRVMEWEELRNGE